MRSAILTLTVFLTLLTSSCFTVGRAPKCTATGEYTVHRISPEEIPPPMALVLLTTGVSKEWDEKVYDLWKDAELGTLSYVCPESKYKGARIEFKLVHDGKRIYAIFRADKDRFVTARKFRRNSFTCRDTCAELFMAPGGEKGGYCNLEISLTGEYLFMFHKNQQRVFDDWGFVPVEDTKNIQVFSSSDGIVRPEITKEIQWHIVTVFDAATIAKHTGVEIPEDLSGQTWNANFYHCSEDSSHKRWFAWNPIPMVSFHLPQYFGKLHFE